MRAIFLIPFFSPQLPAHLLVHTSGETNPMSRSVPTPVALDCEPLPQSHGPSRQVVVRVHAHVPPPAYLATENTTCVRSPELMVYARWQAQVTERASKYPRQRHRPG